MQTAERLAGSVTAASERADWTQAGRLAQDFAGAAGDLGLTGITAAARALAQGARDGAGNEALAKAARRRAWPSTAASAMPCAGSIPTFRPTPNPQTLRRA